MALGAAASATLVATQALADHIPANADQITATAAVTWEGIKAKGRQIRKIAGLVGTLVIGGPDAAADWGKRIAAEHKARVEAEDRRRKTEEEQRRKKREGERGDGSSPPPDPND